MHRYKVLIKYSQLQVSISPFIDEESVLSNEKYSSSHYLAPGIKCNNNVRASSANPSSLGHESGFQSSSSLRSLTPPLLAGSLCEYPIRAMDNGRGNDIDCQIVVHSFVSQVSSIICHQIAWHPSHQGSTTSSFQD